MKFCEVSLCAFLHLNHCIFCAFFKTKCLREILWSFTLRVPCSKIYPTWTTVFYVDFWRHCVMQLLSLYFPFFGWIVTSYNFLFDWTTVLYVAFWRYHVMHYIHFTFLFLAKLLQFPSISFLTESLYFMWLLEDIM